MMSGYIGGANTRVVYLGTQIIGSNASTYNATGITLSDPWPRRHIIVGFSTFALTANLTQPNVTSICGNGSPALVRTEPVGNALFWRQLWIASAPTNASNTITATRAASMAYGAFSAWAAYDLQSATPTDNITSPVADPTSSASINVTAGGIIVLFTNLETARGTITLTGVTKDAQVSGTGTASGTSVTTGSASKMAGPSVSLTSTAGSGGNNNFIAASFR